MNTDPDFATGGATVVSSRFSTFACYYPGTRAQVSYVQTTSAAAANYGAAFTVFGFTGAAKSGYNDQTKVKYTFPTSTGGYWCGNNNYPAQAARVRAWK